jgi:hypothetical protein
LGLTIFEDLERITRQIGDQALLFVHYGGVQHDFLRLRMEDKTAARDVRFLSRRCAGRGLLVLGWLLTGSRLGSLAGLLSRLLTLIFWWLRLSRLWGISGLSGLGRRRLGLRIGSG